MIHDELEYNGWPNYATWNVSLWLNNEEPSYHAYRAALRAAFDPEEERDSNLEAMARALEGFVRVECLQYGAAFASGMAADLRGRYAEEAREEGSLELEYALDQVDWSRIAEHYLDELEEELEEELED